MSCQLFIATTLFLLPLFSHYTLPRFNNIIIITILIWIHMLSQLIIKSVYCLHSHGIYDIIFLLCVHHMQTYSYIDIRVYSIQTINNAKTHRYT